MSDEPVVTLFSHGLLSKWGFNDGDAPDHWLDWCDNQGIDYNALPGWRSSILPRLVEEYLLPAIEQDVKVTKIETNHNPVRAATVDGVDVSDAWYDPDARITLTPERVTIPMTEIAKVAAEIQASG